MTRRTGKRHFRAVCVAILLAFVHAALAQSQGIAEPIAESEYGSKMPRSEFVYRFKFAVKPGLNVYVINYVYRRDQPMIFVRRLEIEGSRDEPTRAIKRITEVYRVYGEE